MMLFLHIILNVSLIRLVWLTKCRRKDLHVPEPLQIIVDGRADHSSSQKSLRIKEYTASGWLKRAPSDTFCLGKTHLISPFHSYTQNARQDDFEIQTNQSDTLQEHDGNVIVASIAYVCQIAFFNFKGVKALQRTLLVLRLSVRQTSFNVPGLLTSCHGDWFLRLSCSKSGYGSFCRRLSWRRSVWRRSRLWTRSDRRASSTILSSWFLRTPVLRC